MKRIVPTLLFICFVLFCKANDSIKHFITPNGINYGIWGNYTTSDKIPLLFVLSGTIEESLGSPYFRQCGDQLGQEYGWMCVSIDLPYHGKYKQEGVPSELAGWAYGFDNGINFVHDNNIRLQSVLNELIARYHIDLNRIAVCGTSRGGYLAMHFAAFEPRINAALVFAPVVNLFCLKEFSIIDRSSKVIDSDLYKKIPDLLLKNLFIVIGADDKRVGSDEVIQFAHEIVKKRLTGGMLGNFELNVMNEPKGHTTPKGGLDRAVKWILELNE